MQIIYKIGTALMLLGLVMFFFGVSMFSHTGPISPLVSELGKYSFLFWLPTIFLGLVLVAVGKRKRRRP